MGSCAHRSIRMGSCAHGIGAAVRGYCTHTRSVAGSCYVTLLLVHNRALVLGVSAWCLLGVCLGFRPAAAAVDATSQEQVHEITN